MTRVNLPRALGLWRKSTPEPAEVASNSRIAGSFDVEGVRLLRSVLYAAPVGVPDSPHTPLNVDLTRTRLAGVHSVNKYLYKYGQERV